jgi:hypothetical protein
VAINQPMPVRNCQLDVLGRAYREGISEQNPDQSEIEKDDYENGTAKRQRKKLFWQQTVHQQVSCPGWTISPLKRTADSPALPWKF